MPYATVAAMIARFGEAEMIRLSAPEGDLDAAVDEAAVVLALTDASSVIDGYLEERYALPVSPVPPALAAACCALARHALGSSRNQVPGDVVTKARDDALAWLQRIASGDVNLAGAAPAAATTTAARVQDRPRITWPNTGAAH